MKRMYLEFGMACLLLVCFYYLSKEAARTSSSLVTEKNVIQEEKNHPEGEKETEDRMTRGRIVLDPGHGGMDPGMIGLYGLEEKSFNLEISEKIKRNLEDAGYEVFLTRSEDYGLYDENSEKKKAQDLQRRIAIVTEMQPDLLVSIHQNSYEDPAICGPQVFYYEDSVEGQKLAAAVQEQLNKIPEVLRKRECKGNKTYYLLKRSPVISILVECGFLTNPQETELLQTERYQEILSEAIVSGIVQYMEQKAG